MPIIQISKIQQRSGNLVDLPQLDNAQFGWAYDENRLFIGSAGPNVQPQNIEVLTSNSTLSFSQINGSGSGNILIQTAQPGQVLSYNSALSAWENIGGNASDPGNSSYYTSSANIHLGNVSNVYMGGGAIGYVLETDGYGKLSWTPKTTVVANIKALTNTTGNILVMTVPNATPYYNGAEVTITGVQGTNSNTIVNSHIFYVKVANDFPTSGNVTLYTDSALTTTANGYYLTATANTGTATTAVVNTGITYAAGSNTSIQYNNGGVLEGSANLSIVGSNLTLTGNFTTSNVWANSGTVSAANLTGTLTTNAQPNITSVGSLINMSVTGNATLGSNLNLTSGNIVLNSGNVLATGRVSASGNVTGGNITTSGVLSATGNVNGANLNIGNIYPTGQVSWGMTGPYIYTAGLGYSLELGSQGAGWSELNYANKNMVYVDSTGAGIEANATGAVKYWYFQNSGDSQFPGNLTANANVVGLNVKTGNVTLFANGNISASGNANIGNITLTTSAANTTITVNNITTGANTANGNVTGNWTLTAGSRWNATYADLAEYYESDAEYEPGTVVEFGGTKEVTLATDSTTRVAGVISTNPAYVLNATCPGEHTALIALQGRVPVKVRGNVTKGDMMISAGEGFAKPTHEPKIGTIIGKSLENFNGVEGVIEIAVGRL